MRGKDYVADSRTNFARAFDGERFVTLIEDLDESVRVQDYPVAGCKVEFIGRAGRRCIGEAAEYAVLRIEQAKNAIGDDHCRRMASGSKSHAVSVLENALLPSSKRSRRLRGDRLRSSECARGGRLGQPCLRVRRGFQ